MAYLKKRPFFKRRARNPAILENHILAALLLIALLVLKMYLSLLAKLLLQNYYVVSTDFLDWLAHQKFY